MHSRNRPKPVTSARSASTGLLLHGSRPSESVVLFFFLGPRKARSRHHEVADLNDRTYGRRRYTFVAELRMPVTARSVIFKGSTFSPLVLLALNLMRAHKVALVGESKSAEQCKFVNSNCESKNTTCSRTELFCRSERSSYYLIILAMRIYLVVYLRAETEEVSANKSVSFGQI